MDETVVAYLLADTVDRSRLPAGGVEDMVSFSEVSSSISRLPVEFKEALKVLSEGSRKRYTVKLTVCVDVLSNSELDELRRN